MKYILYFSINVFAIEIGQDKFNNLYCQLVYNKQLKYVFFLYMQAT